MGGFGNGEGGECAPKTLSERVMLRILELPLTLSSLSLPKSEGFLVFGVASVDGLRLKWER